MSRAAFDYSEVRMDLLKAIKEALSDGASPTNVQLAKAIYVGQATMTKHLKWLIDEGFVRTEGHSSNRRLAVTAAGRAALEGGTFEAAKATEPAAEPKPEAPASDAATGQTDKEDDELLGLFRRLENVDTKELVKELARREGASLIRTREGQQYKITGDSSRIKESGKATILLIRGA